MQHLKILTGLLVSVLTTPAIAVPVYWDMSFLDGEGAQVGSASFYYDDETQSRLITGGTTSPSTITNTYSEIDGFEGYLEGVGTLESAGTTYWFDESANLTAGSTADDYRSRISPTSWFFNQSYEYDDLLHQTIPKHDMVVSFYDHPSFTTLAVNYDGNAVTGGTWISNLTDGGTWTANKHLTGITAVPVPATLPLFGLGLAGLMWLSSRQRSHKSRNLNIA